jgi:O-antigen/teichoic acid export membrane protein
MEVGFYGAAQRTAVGLTIVLFACNYAFAPAVPRYLQEGSREKLEHLYRTVTKWVLMFSSPAAVVVLLCPDQVLHLFGPGFAEGARSALLILTISQWLNIATGPGGYLLLLMSGNHRLMAINSALALVISLPLHLLLIPRYGATGAAIGTGFTTSLLMFVILGQVWWKLRLFPYDARLLGTIIGTLACAGSLQVALWYLPLWTAIAIALGVYAFILCTFGLDRDDRDAWQSLTRAASGRLRATQR